MNIKFLQKQIFIIFFLQKKKPENDGEKIDFNNIPFIKIGYIIPNKNEKSNFKAREFKKIKVNQNLLYIKFVLYKNYINLENKYNQVSIISINFLGQELENDNLIEYNNIFNNFDKNKKEEYKEDNLDEICITKLKEIKQLWICVYKKKNMIVLKYLENFINELNYQEKK